MRDSNEGCQCGAVIGDRYDHADTIHTGYSRYLWFLDTICTTDEVSTY